MIATQQPDAVDRDLVSQCDLILCHRITANDDVSALNRLSHAYMGRELKSYLQQLKNPGEAVMLDDDAETVRIVQIRPRLSRHGGAES